MERNGCMHDNRLSNICMWFIIHSLSFKTINVGCQHSFTRSNTYVHTRAQILLIEIHDIPLELCWHVDFSMTTFNKLNIIHFENEKKTTCGSRFTETRRNPSEKMSIYRSTPIHIDAKLQYSFSFILWIRTIYRRCSHLKSFVIGYQFILEPKFICS